MEVTYKKGILDFRDISPDTIYNRFDLWNDNSQEVVLLSCRKDGIVYSTESLIEDRKAQLGLYLSDVPSDIISLFCEKVFERNPELKSIEYHYGKYPCGYVKAGNHYKIVLPDTQDELDHRLSKKSRYNTKREKDIIEKVFGSYYVDEYEAERCPDSIIEYYFELKKKTHHIDYGMSPQKYLLKYHVSHVYVFKMSDKIGAILFSCEQCPSVFVENLTYDEQYAKYSCGKALYDIFLKRMIEKGKKEVYLGGGYLDYKKKYGSIEENAYHCIVYRNKTIEKTMIMMRKLKLWIKKNVLRKTI